MNNTTSSREKKELQESKDCSSPPAETTLNTGAKDSKIRTSSVAGSVGGSVTTDNTSNTKITVHIEQAIFTDRVAALSEFIEKKATSGTAFGFLPLGNRGDNITQSIGSMSQTSSSEIKQKDGPIVVPVHQTKRQAYKTYASLLKKQLKPTETDSDSSDDSSVDTPTDEMLHKFILDDKSEEVDECEHITDDQLYSMIIQYKAKSSRQAQELNILVKDKDEGAGESPVRKSAESDGNPASKAETSQYEEEDGRALKSELKLDQPLFHLFEIDLSGIECPKVRIVTKENVTKTVEIARHQPEDTGKVTSYLETIFKETHVQSEPESQGNGSDILPDRVKSLRSVYKVDGQKKDPCNVILNLSDIKYDDGYVFMKTKHNLEIIVKVTEKVPSKTKDISQFLTETFLV